MGWEEVEGGFWLIFFQGGGCLISGLGPGGVGWLGERGISDVDSRRLLRTACDWRAWPLGRRGGALCPVGHSRPLSVGGGVNNVATGKINCRQAAGLRAALWPGQGCLVGKASDLSGPEEISQGRLKLTLKILLYDIKAKWPEEIEVVTSKLLMYSESLMQLHPTGFV